MTADHGYGPYTRGCRCKTCRAAKAAYMRERRSVAGVPRRQVLRNGKLAAIGITHGTRYGYEERGCRCSKCCAAHAASDRRLRR